jgi:CSLREA domain-containing protein
MLLISGTVSMLHVPQARAAVTFTVNSTADAVDANPGDGICASGAGDCTLRAAIMESMTGPDLGPYDIIIDAATTAGVIDLTLGGAGEDASATGDLDITRGVVRIRPIEVPTNAVRLAFAGALISATTQGDRIFDVAAGSTLELSGVSIDFARATGDGGAIRNLGTVRIDNEPLPTNTYNQFVFATNSETTGRGGVIYNGPGASLTIEAFPDRGALMSSFSVASSGGTIYNHGGTVSLLAAPGTGLYRAEIYLDAGHATTGEGGVVYNGTGGTVTGGHAQLRWGTAIEGGNLYNAGSFQLDQGGFDRGGADPNRPTALALRGGNAFNTSTGTLRLGLAAPANQFEVAGGRAEEGGGIYNEGLLVHNHVRMSGNVAVRLGGAMYLAPDSTFQAISETWMRDQPNVAEVGAGVFADGGRMEISGTGSYFYAIGNTATSSGGAMELIGGSQLDVNNNGRLVLESNTAPSGGGLVVRESIVRGTLMLFDRNQATAGDGGGLLVDPGSTVEIERSTFLGNSATGSGGAIRQNGLTTDDATVSLVNSTLSGNSAGVSGAAVSVSTGAVSLQHVTVAASQGVALSSTLDNALTLSRSLITDSSTQNCATGSVIVVNDYNVFNDATCGEGVTDVVATGPMLPNLLGPLRSGNDYLDTHSPLAGNPVIDLLPPSLCPAPSIDQRVQNRPLNGDGDTDGECDAGAVEYLRPVSISGRVYAMDSQAPLAGVCAFALTPDLNDGADPVRTDASGNYRIDGLSPGDWVVAFLECDTDLEFLPSPTYAHEWYDDVALDINNFSVPASVSIVAATADVTGIDACMGLVGVTSSPRSACFPASSTTTTTTTTVPNVTPTVLSPVPPPSVTNPPTSIPSGVSVPVTTQPGSDRVPTTTGDVAVVSVNPALPSTNTSEVISPTQAEPPTLALTGMQHRAQLLRGVGMILLGLLLARISRSTRPFWN